MTNLQVKLLKDKCDVTYQGGAVIWEWLQRAEGMILFTWMDGGRPVRRWGRGPRETTRDSRLASLVALWEGEAESQRATARDTNLEWPWVTVRSILSFLTQPFLSFNSPYFPLNRSLLHLAMPFSICPTSFASLHLPGVAPVVILLSVMRKGHGTHGNLSSSVTMLSLANGNCAKTRRRVCTHACVWVWARVHDSWCICVMGV